MEIRIRNLVKTFASAEGRVAAVNDVSLDVPSNRITTLLGPSGCGKTTLLRCIAGLETPDSGEIAIGESVVWARNGQRTANVPAERRGIGMVFQSYAIWPHMTVFENVAYPLEAHGVRRRDIAPRVAEALEFVQMGGFERRPATALSGGQQQRVALARAIVFRPPVILFDEPLSNLDAKLREETRKELRKLLSQLETTSLYVTHDRFEALALSDNIVVLRNGEVAELGSPQDIYFNSHDRFVVDFIGKANFFDVEVKTVKADHTAVDSPLGALLCEPREDVHPGLKCMVYIRMEFVEAMPGGEVAPESPTAGRANRFTGRIKTLVFLGESCEIEVAVGDATLTFRVSPRLGAKEGDEIELYIDPAGCRLLV